MAKTIKKYQLLKDLQLSTLFIVNGKNIPVTFSNGIRKPYLMRGYFSTDDEDLQNAIEADNAYGISFTAVQTIGSAESPLVPAEKNETVENVKAEDEKELAPEPEKVNEPEAEPVAPEPENEVKEPEKEEEKVPEEKKEPVETDYPEVTNFQEARQKMFELFPDIKPTSMPNKSAVINRAKEHKVTFSKLV